MPRSNFKREGPAAAPKSRKKTSRIANQSLARGLDILERFSRKNPVLGVRELSRLLGIDRSIVHRLVQTLAHRGFLEQNPETLRYRVGVAALELGSRYIGGDSLEDAARPVLTDLTTTQQINAYLGVLRQSSAVYLMALQSAGPITIRATPGERVPLHSTALGKILLSSQPEAVIAKLVNRTQLSRYTPKTIVDPATLIEHLEIVRQQGYAIADEEHLPGVFSAAAGVRDRTGAFVAAISGASPQHSQLDQEKFIRIIIDAADQISRNLGFQKANL